MGDPTIRCKNCGHASGYHGNPTCGIDFGSRRPDRCACDQWEGVSYDLDAANERIAQLAHERDTYMQALLDVIHGSEAAAFNKKEQPDE